MTPFFHFQFALNNAGSVAAGKIVFEFIFGLLQIIPLNKVNTMLPKNSKAAGILNMFSNRHAAMLNSGLGNIFYRLLTFFTIDVCYMSTINF